MDVSCRWPSVCWPRRKYLNPKSSSPLKKKKKKKRRNHRHKQTHCTKLTWKYFHNNTTTTTTKYNNTRSTTTTYTIQPTATPTTINQHHHTKTQSPSTATQDDITLWWLEGVSESKTDRHGVTTNESLQQCINQHCVRWPQPQPTKPHWYTCLLYLERTKKKKKFIYIWPILSLCTNF